MVKGLDSFGKDRTRPLGKSYVCFVCSAKLKKEYDAKNKTKANARKSRYKEKNRNKVLANYAMHRAIYHGQLLKPKSCYGCGKVTTDLVGDHFKGYAKKHWLTVQFICRKCDGLRRRKP